jgi:hypothetical protein
MRSRKMIYVALVLVALVSSMSACSRKRGEYAAPPVAASREAASNALVTLQALVTEKNYAALGFNSVEEVKRASLAAPLSVFEIGLDRLKGYQPGQDPDALLTPTSATIYPVTVDAQPRSSVTVVKKDSGYTAASFGQAQIAKGLVQFRGPNVEGTFAVHIPILSMYLIGSRMDKRLMLTPVVATRASLRVGVPVAAEVLLKEVLPLIQTYNGLPL